MIGTDSYHLRVELADPEETLSQPDYRNSTIEVTTVDPHPMSTSDSGIEPVRAQQLGTGVIRLYREFEDDSGDSATSVNSDDTMVSIIAVPTYFTATDLLGFIGDKHMRQISHVRILKSEKPNRFLVLIKFREIVPAASFQFEYNGKPFNSMEPEKCHVIHVKSVKIDYPRNVSSNTDSLIPFLLTDPFTSSSETLLELPSCPVCLERMDSTISGLLTIPCQHTFHCLCLSKWKDDTCPICRYSNNFSNRQVRRTVRRMLNILPPPTTSGSTTLSSLADSDERELCMECPADSGLWICLICGNIGCSRYAPEQHSLKHFVNTGHCFAMELETSRVWDYAGDNYVHRLIANESDGKLVELPGKDDSTASSGKYSEADKVDEVGFEYSQLLISQLASQREYYESLLQEREAPKHRRASSLASINQGVLSDLEIKVDALNEKLKEVTTITVPSLKTKISHKDEKINLLAKDLQSSNLLNEALSKKVDYLADITEERNKTIEELKQENVGLNEQVTDLMFFLDSQEKFKDEPQDVKDGTVVMQAKPKNTRKKR